MGKIFITVSLTYDHDEEVEKLFGQYDCLSDQVYVSHTYDHDEEVEKLFGQYDCLSDQVVLSWRCVILHSEIMLS